MASDKLLTKIQHQIHELAPLLELFVDETIQPSADDCETLQAQLVSLQENLAVYKYNKHNKELSPSFNLHAKLSEKVSVEAVPEIVVEEIKLAAKIEQEEKKEVIAPIHIEKKETESSKGPLLIGINDKFRFMNELFSQNSLEYNIALEQLNNLSNWNDTEIYLNSLKTLYGWKENNETVTHFYSLTKQRFIAS